MHISTRLILGGSQENTVLSCEGQVMLGHEVHLAFGPIYGPEGSLLARVEGFESQGGKIHSHLVPDLVREVSPWRDAKCLGQLKDLIRAIKPDVVHTHSSKAGVLGRWAAWDAFGGGQRPVVVHTIHGPPFNPMPQGGAFRKAKVWGTNYVYELSEKFAARKCHKILSVADAMTQQFLARGIGKPLQYETVWSGMEVGRYLPGPDHAYMRAKVREELGIGQDEVVVGTVARLSPQKGHDDLIDALGQTLVRRNDLRLLWVGDGWLRDRLYARLDALGVRQRVVTTGLVPSEKVPRFISAMDVLAHPSSREGLPRTVPQALLGGVCPVAYDVDGTREACIDGKTGLLVPHGNIEGLRKAVLRVVDDADLRQKLASAGQEMCKHRFDAKVMVDRLEEVYRQARA